MDRIAIHSEIQFEKKRDYVIFDTRSRINRGWSTSESLMQNAGLIAETFLYILDKKDLSLYASTLLVMDKRPQEGLHLPVSTALMMGKVGWVLRKGGQMIDERQSVSEIDEMIRKKLDGNYNENVFQLLHYYLISVLDESD